MKYKNVRLIAVTATSNFVIDDGDCLEPLGITNYSGQQGSPTVRISSTDWPQYATIGFAEVAAGLEQQVTEPKSPDTPPPEV